MKALVYVEPGKTEIQEVADPHLTAPTDVIVDIDATSICGSDLHIVAGTMLDDSGFVLGHEMVGTVREIGDAVREFRPGDRVTMAPAPYCGVCDQCRAGKAPYCRHGGVLGSGEGMGGFPGTHAEAMRVPFADRVLVKVPDNVSDASALAVSDALTTGATGVREAVAAPGQRLAVFGCGPVGLMAIHFATAMKPSQIIAIDPVESRLESAKKLGATHVTAALDARDDVAEMTGRAGVDAVVDAAGVEPTFQAAIDVTAPQSRIALLGIPAKPYSLDVPKVLYKTLNIWAGLGDVTYANTTMKFIADGLLNPDMIFNHETDLDSAPELLETLADPAGHDIIKAVIRPRG